MREEMEEKEKVKEREEEVEQKKEEEELILRVAKLSSYHLSARVYLYLATNNMVI